MPFQQHRPHEAEPRKEWDNPAAQTARLAQAVGHVFRDIADYPVDFRQILAIIDDLPLNVYVKDRASRFLIANKATITGCGAPLPFDLVGKTDFDISEPEQAIPFYCEEQEVMNSGTPIIDVEQRVARLGGHVAWYRTSKYPLYDRDNTVIGLLGISYDVTRQKQAEALRAGQAEILELIAENAALDVVFDRIIRLIESQIDGIIGSFLSLDSHDRLHPCSAPHLPPDYVAALDGLLIGPEVGCCGTACFHRRTVIVEDILSDPLWAPYRDLVAPYGLRSCWSAPIITTDDTVLGTFALYSKTVRKPDPLEEQLVQLGARLGRIALDRKRAEEVIRLMAEQDSLTGLPNRHQLNSRLATMLTEAERAGRRAGVAFIDLDNFKLINDSLGHGAGDEVLKTMGRRMRDSCGSDDFVARIGGDEFVVVFADLPPKQSDALRQVRSFIEAISDPIPLQTKTFAVSCSVGLAVFPAQGRDADTLLSHADTAMYKAKQLGRNNVQLFNAALTRGMRERLEWTQDLRRALANGEIVLNYQPQVDLASRRIRAFEALVRWRHPTRGLISPADFIPLAETTGLIAPLGEYVLIEACRQNRAWQDMGLPGVIISVNVSAHQFRDRLIVAQVDRALAASGMAAEWLELELTESILMHDEAEAISIMRELRDRGVHFAIDDFGTGVSNLSSLKKFPVERLKIDRSFIQDLGTDEDDRAITAAIICIGQKLRMLVLAEGVETEEQMRFLQDNNCDEIQGYSVSPPVSADAATALMRAGPA